MKQLQIRTTGFALMAICALCTVLPTASFADLRSIACNGIWRGCLANCTDNGGYQACYDDCDQQYGRCKRNGATTKQQTPPPPCTGVTCTFRNPHPPTKVSNPTQPSLPPGKPTQVNPVNISNPNKTGSANKNDASGHGKSR